MQLWHINKQRAKNIIYKELDDNEMSMMMMIYITRWSIQWPIIVPRGTKVLRNK